MMRLLPPCLAFLFTAVLHVPSAEPPAVTPTGIGIFDGVYEPVIGSPNDILLQPGDYDVTYDPVQGSYTVRIDQARFKRDCVYLRKKVSGSFAVSASIIFSTTRANYFTMLMVQDTQREIGCRTLVDGVERKIKNSILFRDGTKGNNYVFGDRAFSEASEEKIHYRITYYADLHQVVAEFSRDGTDWDSILYYSSYAFEKDCNMAIQVEANQPACFRIENITSLSMNFAYGKRMVEKIDDQSARVAIDITNPTDRPLPVQIKECVAGEVSATSVSHEGSVEDATSCLELHRLRWSLPAAPGKTQLEYTLHARDAAVLPTTIFGGNINEKVVMGENYYSFADLKEKTEDIQHWRTWSAADGLPDSIARYVNLGPSGSVYVMNYNPDTKISLLNRFDGFAFNPITLGNLPDGLVKEGPDGSLWFYENWHLYRQMKDQAGTISWEMCRDTADRTFEISDRSTRAFVHCGNPAMGGNTAKYLFVPLDHEQVYCLYNDDLKLYNAATRKATVVLKAASTSLESFGHMILAQDQRLVITGERGVIKVNIQDPLAPSISEEYSVPADSPLQNFSLPVEGMTGNLLLRANQELGTAREPLVILDSKLHSRDLGQIAPLALSEDNGIWMVGTKGYNKEFIAYCQANEKVIIPQQNHRITSLTGDSAYEKNGSFWLATNHGIMRYAPPLWRKPMGSRDLQSEISVITEDRAGNLWALDQNHLLKYDGREWKKYPKPITFTIWQYKPQSLVFLPNGRLAVQVGDTPLKPKPFCVFDPVTGIFELVYHPKKLHCDDISPGQSHPLLMVMYDEKENAQLEAYENQEFINLIPPGSIRMGILCIYERDNGEILIGSNSGEHLQWFRNGQKVQWTEEQQYPGTTALSILEVEKDKIWVGDTNSLYEFDGQRWTKLRTGMDHILSMIKARDGSVWIASWSGLHHYIDGSWITYNSEDGFRYDMVNKIFEDSQGRLWAGSADGIYLFHPEADPDPPQTYIKPEENLNDFSYNGEVRISFTGLDKWKYTPKEQLLYSCRLNQGPWTSFTPATLATYNRLRPGYYTLEARAMDRKGNADPTPAAFTFRVNHAPIQERRWFVPAVAATLSLILLLALIALRSRSLLARFALNLEGMVTERTRQLRETEGHLLQVAEHEQQRIGQDLHDDVVQNLVGVALRSELLMKELEAAAPQKVEEVREILQQVDEATHRTRQLAQGLSPVNLHQLGLLGSLQSLAAGLEEFHNLSCSVPDDMEVTGLSPRQQLNLYRIAQEAATNAAKHAQARHIEIGLRRENGNLTLTVRDDGQGFDPRASYPGMGLPILRYRAQDMGAVLGITSAPGQGTTVTCVLPLPDGDESTAQFQTNEAAT